MIWEKSIRIDEKWDTRVEILRGQEPSDVIYASLRPYAIPYSSKKRVFEEVKKAGIPYTRESALVFSQNIFLEDNSFTGLFTMYDDGSEPIDVVYDFAEKHSIEAHFEPLSKALLPKLCELVSCQREIPVVWKSAITREDGEHLGSLGILRGDEPIDSIDHFIQTISPSDVVNPLGFRQQLLVAVCKSIECTRSTPVVYRKSINDSNGKRIGDVEILEDEEVIDGVVRFIRKSKVDTDEIALKNHMLQEACRVNRVKCTRNVGVIFSHNITKEDGSFISTLTVFENEEPADKVYRWCQDNNLNLVYMENIINTVCESDLVICHRREPVYFSIPISGPEGERIDTFQIKVAHEPVDEMYRFFAKNGLFQKGWEFKAFVNQICNQPAVDCRRRKAVKHFDKNFTMGGLDLGQLVIWEDEEVVDVLYNIRQRYNLTLDDQTRSLSEICKSSEVYCKRAKAVIYRKTDITKLDFEKFGNETCRRQFVGFKFTSSFANLPLGGKLAEFLKEDPAKSVSCHRCGSFSIRLPSYLVYYSILILTFYIPGR